MAFFQNISFRRKYEVVKRWIKHWREKENKWFCCLDFTDRWWSDFEYWWSKWWCILDWNPSRFTYHFYTNPIQSIFSTTYPNFENNFDNLAYLRECAIVTPRNITVVEINDYAIELLPGEMHTYLSSDSLCSSSKNFENLNIMYPTEFLNILEFNSLPSHSLTLKIKMHVLLLRNLIKLLVYAMEQD